MSAAVVLVFNVTTDSIYAKMNGKINIYIYMKILRQHLSRTKHRIGGVVSVDLCLPVRVVHEIDLMKVLKFD